MCLLKYATTLCCHIKGPAFFSSSYDEGYFGFTLYCFSLLSTISNLHVSAVILKLITFFYLIHENVKDVFAVTFEIRKSTRNRNLGCPLHFKERKISLHDTHFLNPVYILEILFYFSANSTPGAS